MDVTRWINLYRVIYTARQVDKAEQALTARGEAFFQVSSAGHEGSAVLAAHLTSQDYLFCHYRDKGLLLARGLSPQNFLEGLLCKDESSSRGRQMYAMVSDVRLRIATMSGPVGNASLHAIGTARSVRDQESGPIIVCSVGDGTTQEGEFLEACSEAVRSSLPVLFLIQDNHWAISTPTSGRTFYSLPNGPANEFLGRTIHRIDGRNVVTADPQLGEIVSRIRTTRQPEFVIFDVDRIANHTHADDQAQYRSSDELRRAESEGDPLLVLERQLRELGMTSVELRDIQREVEQTVGSAESAALAGSEPLPTILAKRSIPMELTHESRERRGIDSAKRLTMRESIRDVLRHRLRSHRNVSLLGEDIEDPKGDVFGVTKGLSTEFPGRVENAPLSEATIIGMSIGRALAGDHPVAFIQFADFLPLAFNQIASDLSTIHWRSDGQWPTPVIIMVPCGAYRPGLGPFHAQTFESLILHMPGIDVFMPSTATDAAGLLNAAFESRRPTVFFYPKALLNDPEQQTSVDVDRQFVPIGPCRKVRAGRDITFVAWGNTVRICDRVAAELEKVGIESEILDLRSLSPWDERAVLASAEKTARLVVVHEDNQTCGFGAEILAQVAEKSRVPVSMRRVTRPDTHVPCNFGNALQILPSVRRVLTTAAELLDLELTWIATADEKPGTISIQAIGSGPADETVVVAEVLAKPGDQIRRGQIVASLEATKNVFDLASPAEGEVLEILVRDGETVAVGAPVIRLKFDSEQTIRRPVTAESIGTPVLLRRTSTDRLKIAHRAGSPRRFQVGISQVMAEEGSLTIDNGELLRWSASGGDVRMSPEDIIRRTGIEERRWVGQDDDAVKMAVRACWRTLDRENLIPDDLSLVICSTTTPIAVAPSMACRILQALTSGKSQAMVQAYDISAACSGYLYALQAGYDFLQSMPGGRVLVVTSEVLSPLLDRTDLDTSILFGDAATATILYGEECLDRAKAELHRPELSAKGDDAQSLSVPLPGDGFIRMKGRKVFTEAVRAMVSSLNRVCQHQGLQVDELKLIVPHQANQRIIEAIQSRIGATVFSNIRRHGNTSSSSIPLCLSEILTKLPAGDRVGLCAFGGGYTFGAGILELN